MKNNISQESENDGLMFYISPFFELYKKKFADTHSEKCLEIDAREMSEISPKLHESLIAEPKKVIDLLDMGLEKIFIGEDKKIRLKNFCNPIDIHKIRVRDLNHIFNIKGIIKRITKVIPRTEMIQYRCVTCGTVRGIPQDARKKEVPKRCSCGAKNTRFTVESEKIKNIQELNLEEIQENLEGRQPQQLRVYLEDELTDGSLCTRLQPGKKIEVIGIIEKLPTFMTTKDEESNLSEFMLYANNIVPMESEDDLTITPEDEAKIKDIAKNNPLQKLANSLIPEVYGNDMVKKALVLQTVKGVGKEKSDGTFSREDINILLVGDVGVAKSVSLKATVARTPKARMVVGTKTSKVGLGAMAVKDELTQTWSVTGDTLILCLDNKNNFYLKKIEELYTEKDFNNLKILGVNEKTKKPKWVKCKEIICHPFTGKIINLKQKHGEVTATECHSVYDKDMKLFQSQENKEMYSLRNITIPNKNQFIINLVEMINGRNKKNGRFLGSGKLMKPKYSNERDIKDLLKICAWYISEGCLSKNEKRYSWKVVISNNNRKELEEIARAFQRISESKSNLSKYGGKRINKKSRGKIINVVRTSSLELCSKQLYYFLKENCGHYSINKKIPHFIFNLNSKYKEYFFNQLMKGDGCFKRNSYTTISKELATGIGVLLSSMNKNFSYVYGTVDNNHPNSAYQINLVKNNFNNKHQSKNLLQVLFDNFKYQWFSVRDFEKAYKKGSNKYNRKDYSKNFMFIKRLNKRGVLQRKIVNSRKILYKIKLPNLACRLIELSKNSGVSNKINIRDSKDELVYDIVNSETSNFVGGMGNILLHNSLEVGALVLCNDSLLAIDELDKMYKEHLNDLLEPMSAATVTIAKAGINACLPAKTSILASANPIYGNYDLGQPLAKQIDLPSPILNRFDLIFVMIDRPNEEFDSKAVEHIFKSYKEKMVAEIPIELFKKYIIYCKKLRPMLADNLVNYVQEFYINLREKSNRPEIKAIPVNLRNMEALIKLAEANAKLRLSPIVEVEDLEVAKNIFMYCIKQIGIDEDSGAIDMSRSYDKMPLSKRAKMDKFLELIYTLTKDDRDVELFYSVIMEQAKTILGMKPWEVNICLETLHKENKIYEPRKGVFKVVP